MNFVTFSNEFARGGLPKMKPTEIRLILCALMQCQMQKKKQRVLVSKTSLLETSPHWWRQFERHGDCSPLYMAIDAIGDYVRLDPQPDSRYRVTLGMKFSARVRDNDPGTVGFAVVPIDRLKYFTTWRQCVLLCLMASFVNLDQKSARRLTVAALRKCLGMEGRVYDEPKYLMRAVRAIIESIERLTLIRCTLTYTVDRDTGYIVFDVDRITWPVQKPNSHGQQEQHASQPHRKRPGAYIADPEAHQYERRPQRKVASTAKRKHHIGVVRSL